MTFPNLKKYVGVTNNFGQRLSQHRASYSGRRPGSLVHRAIAKYGESNVNIKILGYFTEYSEALEFEKQMIKEFDCFKHGYNLTEGGQGTLGLKYKFKRRKPLTVERREHIAKTLGTTETHVFKGSRLVGTWTNLNELCKSLKIHRSNVTACLKGRLKSTGGYTFGK